MSLCKLPDSSLLYFSFLLPIHELPFTMRKVYVCLSTLLKNESISVGALKETLHLLLLTQTHCTQMRSEVEFKAQSSITGRLFEGD